MTNNLKDKIEITKGFFSIFKEIGLVILIFLIIIWPQLVTRWLISSGIEEVDLGIFKAKLANIAETTENASLKVQELESSISNEVIPTLRELQEQTTSQNTRQIESIIQNLERISLQSSEIQESLEESEQTLREAQQELLVIENSRLPSSVYREVAGGREIDEIIIIDTQSENLEQEIEALKNFKVSYHYLIDKNGEVHLLVDEADIAFHTSGKNTNSIGIGLIHVSGQPYTNEQLSSLSYLLADIIRRYNIQLDKIIPASQVATYKKSDLPPLMNQLRERVLQNL